MRDAERILDEYLVTASRGGSRAAMEELAKRWTPRLIRFAARMLGTAEGAGDIAQETWASALPALRRLRDPAHFPAWIYAIARRKCADAVRSAVRRRRLSAAVAAEPVPAPASVDDGERGGLARAMAALPPEQRAALSLFYGEDLSLQEIAVVLGVPLGTVKSRLHTARAALREEFKEIEDEQAR